MKLTLNKLETKALSKIIKVLVPGHNYAETSLKSEVNEQGEFTLEIHPDSVVIVLKAGLTAAKEAKTVLVQTLIGLSVVKDSFLSKCLKVDKDIISNNESFNPSEKINTDGAVKVSDVLNSFVNGEEQPQVGIQMIRVTKEMLENDPRLKALLSNHLK